MNNTLELAKQLVAELEKQENAKDSTENDNEKVELSTLNSGDVFKIGENVFIVLEQMQGQTKVISKDFMAEDVVFSDDSTNYNESNLKDVIEDDIQPIIEAAVGADNLVEHEVDLISVDMQELYPKCKCKVRPITFDEARQYNDLIANENLDDWWWTCTPWSTPKRGCKYSIAVVLPGGDIGGCNCRNDSGVRPVCILKSHIFVSKGDK